jgi:hypothetical protein
MKGIWHSKNSKYDIIMRTDMGHLKDNNIMRDRDRKEKLEEALSIARTEKNVSDFVHGSGVEQE